jgi:hypothetical protein
MRRISRDAWLAVGLIALLVTITIAAAVQQARAQTTSPPLSSSSSSADGARALWLWLDELGYTVSSAVDVGFTVPDGTRLVLLLEPTAGIESGEWNVLDRWVEAGGTLVLAGDGLGTAFALRHYEFDLRYGDSPIANLTVQSPLLASPPIVVPTTVHSTACLESQRGDYVVFLASGACPVLLSFPQGAGRVLLSTAPFPFSNAGLKEPGNPALVLNLVGTAGRPGQVWFDEWHHGVRLQSQEVVGPEEWLRYTWAGNALLFTGGVVFLALVLRGRRFGRPVPLPKSIVRRSPLEYVTAIAQLNWHAGHRLAVLQRYRFWLKRDLGKRYRLSPALPDDEYVARLAAYNPNVDAGALRSLLARLSRGQASESETVQLAAEAAEWMGQFEK